MVKSRVPPQIPAHHTRHYFAPGTLEHHRSRIHHRHVRVAARWFGRVLGLLFLAAVVAAGASVFGGK